MACGVDGRPRFVNLAVDGKRRTIDGILRPAGQYHALFVHQNQITDADLGEVLAERIDPEVFCEFIGQ